MISGDKVDVMNVNINIQHMNNVNIIKNMYHII